MPIFEVAHCASLIGTNEKVQISMANGKIIYDKSKKLILLGCYEGGLITNNDSELYSNFSLIETLLTKADEFGFIDLEIKTTSNFFDFKFKNFDLLTGINQRFRILVSETKRCAIEVNNASNNLVSSQNFSSTNLSLPDLSLQKTEQMLFGSITENSLSITSINKYSRELVWTLGCGSFNAISGAPSYKHYFMNNGAYKSPTLNLYTVAKFPSSSTEAGPLSLLNNGGGGGYYENLEIIDNNVVVVDGSLAVDEISVRDLFRNTNTDLITSKLDIYELYNNWLVTAQDSLSSLLVSNRIWTQNLL